MLRTDLEDGKYTVIFDEATGGLSALRYGQVWRDLAGDKLVLALVHRIDELQRELDPKKWPAVKA